MCKALFNFLRCIIITVNVIFFIVGIAFFASALYARSQVDFEKVIGNQYKEHIPPVEDFLGVKRQNDGGGSGSGGSGSGNSSESDIDSVSSSETKISSSSDGGGGDDSGGAGGGGGGFPDFLPDSVRKKILEVDAFVDQKLDDISGAILNTLNVIMIVGIVAAIIALLGIIAFSCCNKVRFFLFFYLFLLVLLFIGLLVVTILSIEQRTLQSWIFAVLEGVAFDERPASRFLMAALQYWGNCCGIRGSVDYACHGVYDYKCNPGCFTFKEIWDAMLKIENSMPPVCTIAQSLVDECLKIADLPVQPIDASNFTRENCETKLNIPMPIDAVGSDQCQDYKTSFDLDGNSDRKFDLKKFDPAINFTSAQNPTVFGSLFFSGNDSELRIVDLEGCGFKLWTEVPISYGLNIAFFILLVFTLFVVFEIALVIYCFASSKKRKEQNNKK